MSIILQNSNVFFKKLKENNYYQDVEEDRGRTMPNYQEGRVSNCLWTLQLLRPSWLRN